MKNNFLYEMQKRGYLNQCTNLDKLSEICRKNPISGYIGFDCTASSLHVGSLLQIMILKLMQKHGHRPIVLLGGGTTLIGDPSGKDTTRKMLNEGEIKKNIDSIKKVFNKILDTTNKNTSPIFVNNAEWLTKLKYIDFLRDIGSHFTINKMLTFDSVKLRLDREQSLSYMEFNYMILQAYDFYELFKNDKCILQIGGSDQWGNIVNGVDLIRRKFQKEAFGITSPLITLASGAKMGKTEKGAIWLDKKLLSPFEYWQFWRNTDDRDVLKFLKMFTDLSVNEINKIANDNINSLKIVLANETTKMLHGANAALKAEQTAKNIFEKGSIGDELKTIKIKKKIIENNINIIDFIMYTNFFASKGEIRRTIKNKGLKINNETINDENLIISKQIFNEKDFLKISHGKKNHIVIKIID